MDKEAKLREEMLDTCKKCGAILEYDPETGYMECPIEKYETDWIKANWGCLSMPHKFKSWNEIR